MSAYTRGQRVIHQADALDWLPKQGKLAGCSLVTSMPDFTEFPQLSLEEWKLWFTKAASLVLAACPPEGVVIFYQRDSKKDGAWVDKGYLCQKAAEAAGFAQLWHKVVCRAPAGNVTFGRPAYSHLLCFAPTLRLPLEVASADVIPSPGRVTWTRGMGGKACEVACRFILEQTATRTVVDPFCGHGTVLAVANQMGMDAIGVELSRRRAERARELEVGAIL